MRQAEPYIGPGGERRTRGRNVWQKLGFWGVAGLAVAVTGAGAAPAGCSPSGSSEAVVTGKPNRIVQFDGRSSYPVAPGSKSYEWVIYNTGGEVDVTAPDPGHPGKYMVKGQWNGGTKAVADCFYGPRSAPIALEGGNYGGPSSITGVMFIDPRSRAVEEVVQLIQAGLPPC